MMGRGTIAEKWYNIVMYSIESLDNMRVIEEEFLDVSLNGVHELLVVAFEKQNGAESVLSKSCQEPLKEPSVACA